MPKAKLVWEKIGDHWYLLNTRKDVIIGIIAVAILFPQWGIEASPKIASKLQGTVIPELPCRKFKKKSFWQDLW